MPFEVEEIDPFADDVPEHYLKRHPFGRVPVLSHNGFEVYETTAICRYVDAAFDGPHLIPSAARKSARLAQVVSIVESYGYVPMVRQVFANRVFRPAEGIDADEGEIRKGMIASMPVLHALNEIASEAAVLDKVSFTLADCHLAPMVAYFVQATEGRAALAQFPALSSWWNWASRRASVIKTNPGLPPR